MKEKIKFGIIGCGDITRKKYIPAIQNTEEYILESICDINEKRVKDALNEWGANSYYTDYCKMLKEADIDVVLVNTPPNYHIDPIIKSAEAKKHILVEKPLAVNMDEINRIMSAVKNNRVKLLALPFEYSDNYYKCKELIETGIIGEIISVECVVTHEVFPATPWYFSKEAGIGVLGDIGIYSLSSAIALIGSVKEVYCKTAKGTPEVKLNDGNMYTLEQEDTVHLVLKWENRITGSLYCGWGQGGIDEGAKVIINGREGSLILTGWGHHKLILYTRFPDRIPVGSEEIQIFGKKMYLINKKATWGIETLSFFIKAIREDIDLTEDYNRIRHTMDVVFKAYESDKKNCAVKLETSFDGSKLCQKK